MSKEADESLSWTDPKSSVHLHTLPSITVCRVVAPVSWHWVLSSLNEVLDENNFTRLRWVTFTTNGNTMFTLVAPSNMHNSVSKLYETVVSILNSMSLLTQRQSKGSHGQRRTNNNQVGRGEGESPLDSPTGKMEGSFSRTASVGQRTRIDVV